MSRMLIRLVRKWPKALAQNVKSILFDRSGYKYHGQVKAVSEGAREGGLQF